MKSAGLVDFMFADGCRQPNLFSVMDAEERRTFKSLCVTTSFDPGQFIFVQDDDHTYSYIIEEGLVRTFYVSPSGREITLGYWTPGEMVGGPSVLGDAVHVWSAIAAQPTRLLAISGPALREFTVSRPAVSEWIIDTLTFKLRWLSILFQIHGTDCVEDRLAKLLILLAENYGAPCANGHTMITQHISQGGLGTLIGASRQWTNKTLNDFVRNGVIELKGRQIILRDANALRRQLGAPKARH